MSARLKEASVLEELLKSARPFLKWAGGKGQLLAELHAQLSRVDKFNHYHEPFVGGGAFFFSLYSQGMLKKKQAHLSDANPNLIETYTAVRDAPDELIRLLRGHAGKHSEEHYYRVREEVPGKAVARAARVVYLNRTCYNGLYRENSSGQFNVPMGRYKNPTICDAPNLMAVSEALHSATLKVAHFREVVASAKRGDFVYFDPPYWPVSSTSSFTSYAKDRFGPAEQEELAEVFQKLTKKGVHALLSNSDVPEVRALYSAFSMTRVYATRNVNSKAERRGKLAEVLVRNF